MVMSVCVCVCVCTRLRLLFLGTFYLTCDQMGERHGNLFVSERLTRERRESERESGEEAKKKTNNVDHNVISGTGRSHSESEKGQWGRGYTSTLQEIQLICNLALSLSLSVSLYLSLPLPLPNTPQPSPLLSLLAPFDRAWQGKTSCFDQRRVEVMGCQKEHQRMGLKCLPCTWLLVTPLPLPAPYPPLASQFTLSALPSPFLLPGEAKGWEQVAPWPV